MSLIRRVKDLLTGDGGVTYVCSTCGAQFDEIRESCPECGSTEILERDAFEFRPD